MGTGQNTNPKSPKPQRWFCSLKKSKLSFSVLVILVRPLKRLFWPSRHQTEAWACASHRSDS